MGVEPYALVSLMEILEHNASAFCRLSSVIGQLVVIFDTGHMPASEGVGGSLGELQREVEKLGLPSANKQLKRIYEAFTQAGTRAPEMRAMLMELFNRLLDDLEERAFVAIPREMTTFYRQADPPFGKAVLDAFPLADEDISEAAKCLALDRSTAAVFHLMRAMEVAVHAIGDKFGVTVIDKHSVDLEWGKIVANLKVPIEAMFRGPERDRWSEVLTLLYHVKQAWRNDTMHPKQTYTFTEAKVIFVAVNTFMNHLATLELPA